MYRLPITELDLVPKWSGPELVLPLLDSGVLLKQVIDIMNINIHVYETGAR